MPVKPGGFAGKAWSICWQSPSLGSPLTNGLSQGDFTLLRVLDPATGQMTNVLALIGAARGGAVTSATAPLSINSGVLSINLTGYIPITHEAYNVGQANVNFGAYDARTRTLTLENASGDRLGAHTP